MKNRTLRKRQSAARAFTTTLEAREHVQVANKLWHWRSQYDTPTKQVRTAALVHEFQLRQAHKMGPVCQQISA